MDKFREFQENFCAHFKSLYKEMRGKFNRELDDALILHGTSEEQCQLISEVCRDVDKEHDIMEEMLHSGKTPGKFLRQNIVETIKDIRPNATDEEVSQVVEATMDAMEKDIERDANQLLNEALMVTDALQIKMEKEK